MHQKVIQRLQRCGNPASVFGFAARANVTTPLTRVLQFIFIVYYTSNSIGVNVNVVIVHKRRQGLFEETNVVAASQ